MQVELDIDDLVRETLQSADLLAEVDISDMVRDVIDDMSYSEILEGVDVEELAREEIERADLLDGIDLDKIVAARVEELVDDVEFHSYKSLRKEFVDFSDEVKGLREDNRKLWNSILVMSEDIQLIRNAFFMLKAKVEKRPWYKFW